MRAGRVGISLAIVVSFIGVQLRSGPAAAQAGPPPAYPPAAGQPSQRADYEQARYARPAPRRRPIGMMIGGIVTLGVSYGFSALVGVELLSMDNANSGRVCTNCSTVGPRLLIPIAGPWLALPDANGDGGKALSALLGAAQLTGLILTIAGVSRYKAAGSPSSDTALASDLGLAFAPTRGGGAGVLSGRF